MSYAPRHKRFVYRLLLLFLHLAHVFFIFAQRVCRQRAANKATESAAKLAASVPSMPSFDTVKGDWKFWIGLLAIVSFGTALLTAQAPMMPTSTSSEPSSYFI
jgi:hypothetical protein